MRKKHEITVHGSKNFYRVTRDDGAVFEIEVGNRIWLNGIPRNSVREAINDIRRELTEYDSIVSLNELMAGRA